MCRSPDVIGVREDKWFLLAFHSKPPDDPNGTDYVDLYGVRFDPQTVRLVMKTASSSFLG